MKEEIELYKNITEEEQPQNPNITINGDIIISINNENTKKTNTKKIRNKLTKPLKKEIKKRDSKKCTCCNKTFKNHLEIHHIMPVSKYPELAYDPENLVSLCQKCHAKYHEYYRNQEGARTFIKFIKKHGK